MKRIISVFVAILTIFCLGATVQAASATMDLKISKETIKPGDTFTASLSINCPEGINGVVGIKATYDTSKLELVSCQTSSNFSNLGTESEADLIVLSNNKITSDDVFTWNFKAKESITEEAQVSISIEDLTVDSDSNTDSEVNLSGISKTIIIKPENAVDPAEEPSEDPSEEPTQEPGENPGEEPTQDPGENPSEEPTQEPSENPSEEPTQETSENPSEEPTQKPGEDSTQKPSQNPTTSDDKTKDSNKDKTVYPADGNEKGGILPYTGKGKIFIGMVIACVISLIIAYKKYSQYRGI